MPNALPADPRFRALLAAALTAGGCGLRPVPSVEAPSEPTQTSNSAEASAKDPDGDSDSVASGGAPKTGDAACDEAAMKPGAGLRPTQPVDAVLLRSATTKRGSSSAKRTVQHSIGTACEGANDADACRAELDASWTQAGLRSTSYPRQQTSWHLAYTRGDKAGTLATMDALRTFLGPIDSAGDATTLAWASGYDVHCPAPEATDQGYVVHARLEVSDCPMTRHDVRLTISKDGDLSEEVLNIESSSVCAGRLPPMRSAADARVPGVAGWLARTAWLEAQAVTAFEHLELELRAHGAPTALIDACTAARHDEIRHAARVGEIACDRGIAPPDRDPSDGETGPIRDLRAIALDNAIEGLARETWGAVVAAAQAQRAEDPDVRALFAELAEDEARHAELSRAIYAWIQPRLAPRDRAVVDAARDAAWDVLASAEPEPADVRAALGLPDAEHARSMIGVLRSAEA